MLDDVGAHTLGGRGGEGDHRRVRKEVAKLRDLAVFRPKIVPPFRDAVGLVDGKRGNAPGAEIFLPVVEHEALGSGVEQAVFAIVQAAQPGSGFGGAEE